MCLGSSVPRPCVIVAHSRQYPGTCSVGSTEYMCIEPAQLSPLSMDGARLAAVAGAPSTKTSI